MALAAGVAKGTLYRYFENKGDLYVALLAENGRVFEERDTADAPPVDSQAYFLQERSSWNE